MKIEPKKKQSQDSNPDTGAITGENYLSRVSSFLRLGGVPFVIRALDGDKGAFRTKLLATEPQWIAWRSWFISKGMGTRAMDAAGMTTVPCEYPEFFDKDASVSDAFARLPRRSPVDQEAMRGRLNQLFAGLAGEVGAWPADRRPRQPSGAQAKADAIQMLAERREEWASPLELSPEAKRFAKFSDDEDPQF